MSTFADKASDWWETKNQRERLLLIALAVTAPITIAFFLGSYISDGLNKIEANNNKMRRALVVLEELIARGPAQPVDNVLLSMPTEPIALESYLTRAAQRAKVVIPRFNPRAQVTRDGFVTSGMQIDLNDVTLEQARLFFEAVENGESPYVAVTSVSVSRKLAAKEKLNFKLDITAYAKVPEKPAESPAGGGSAGSGSATAGGGAAAGDAGDSPSGR